MKISSNIPKIGNKVDSYDLLYELILFTNSSRVYIFTYLFKNNATERNDK